jgi:hypothetical protein
LFDCKKHIFYNQTLRVHAARRIFDFKALGHHQIHRAALVII